MFAKVLKIKIQEHLLVLPLKCFAFSRLTHRHHKGHVSNLCLSAGRVPIHSSQQGGENRTHRARGPGPICPPQSVLLPLPPAFHTVGLWLRCGNWNRSTRRRKH